MCNLLTKKKEILAFNGSLPYVKKNCSHRYNKENLRIGNKTNCRKGIAKSILQQKLGALSQNTWTMCGFSCFEKFFRYVNGNELKISGSNNDDFIINNFNLTGLDILWNIALYCTDNQVSDRAVELINSLYEKVSHYKITFFD